MSTRTILALWLLLLAAPAVVQAEVSVDLDGTRANTLIMGSITDDPDPVGIWMQRRAIPSNRVLNASGHARGDGPPDVGFRTNGSPIAVWAYKTGSDFDIAFSEWDGIAWTPPFFLTASSLGDEDPRTFVEPDGTIHVTWWRYEEDDDEIENERIMWTSRAAGSTVWTPITTVLNCNKSCRRPTIAVFSGGPRIGYESRGGGAGSANDFKVIVGLVGPGGSFTEERVWPSDESQYCLPVLQLGARSWVSWIDGADRLGYSEYESPNWTPADKESNADRSWIGIEDARARIRQILQE